MGWKNWTDTLDKCTIFYVIWIGVHSIGGHSFLSAKFWMPHYKRVWQCMQRNRLTLHKQWLIIFLRSGSLYWEGILLLWTGQTITKQGAPWTATTIMVRIPTAKSRGKDWQVRRKVLAINYPWPPTTLPHQGHNGQHRICQPALNTTHTSHLSVWS